MPPEKAACTYTNAKPLYETVSQEVLPMPEVTLDLSSPANILLREVLGWLLLSIGLWKVSGKMK